MSKRTVVDPAKLERLVELHGTLSEEEQAALDLLVARAGHAVDAMALAQMPAEALLTPDEAALVAELDAQPDPPALLPEKPALVTKVTRLCNLRCTYCHSWGEGRNQNMSFETLARLLHGVLRDPGVRVPVFVWHGGEPTLRSPEFFLKAFWLQLHWRRSDQVIHNQLQTNAANVSDEFIDLCRRFRISVSVSLDGPPEIHDRQRLDAAGRPTHARVREGLDRLRAAGLTQAVLMVVDEDTVALGPERILEYLLELGVPMVGLLNALPELDDDRLVPGGSMLPWGTWQRFLRDLFNLWWPTYSDQLRIRELTELIRAMQGQVARKCHHADDCFGFFFTIEHDGTASACSKYDGDSTSGYGSILTAPVGEVLTGTKVQAKRERDLRETAEIEECRWSHVCRGGCPFDRAVNSATGVPVPDGCCGLGPLLDDMQAALEGTIGSDEVGSVWGEVPPPARLGLPTSISTVDGGGVPVTLQRRPRRTATSPSEQDPASWAG